MKEQSALSDGRKSFVLFLFGSLCLGALITPSLPAQNAPLHHTASGAGCRAVMTTRDAERCIGSVRPTAPVPKLDSSHPYTLPELIDIAETASPEGRIAWAIAKQALEATGIERAHYLPLLTFVAGVGDDRVIVPSPKPLAPRGYVLVNQPVAVAQLQLEYSLLDYGRGPRLEATRALELAAALRLGRVHQTVAFGTAGKYYAVQEAIGQLEAAKTILQTAETLLESAQAQFDNGRATLPDLQNAQAGAAQARYELASAEGAVKSAKLSLTEATGVEPTVEIEIAQQDQAGPSTLDASVEDLIHAAWASRPDLLAQAQEVRHAGHALRAARAAFRPEIGVSAGGGQTNIWPTADYGQLGAASAPTWSVRATLRWELFNAARRHEVNSALAAQRSAAEQQRATQDAVTRQVWEAYVDYQTAMEQRRSSQAFLTAAQISYDSSLAAYNYGVRSLVDVVQSERQLAQARLAAVRSYARVMQSAVSLSYATGSLLQTTNPTPPGARHP